MKDNSDIYGINYKNNDHNSYDNIHDDIYGNNNNNNNDNNYDSFINSDDDGITKQTLNVIPN